MSSLLTDEGGKTYTNIWEVLYTWETDVAVFLLYQKVLEWNAAVSTFFVNVFFFMPMMCV